MVSEFRSSQTQGYDTLQEVNPGPETAFLWEQKAERHRLRK